MANPEITAAALGQAVEWTRATRGLHAAPITGQLAQAAHHHQQSPGDAAALVLVRARGGVAKSALAHDSWWSGMRAVCLWMTACLCVSV